MRQKTLKAASIGRRIAAIAHMHEQAGHPSPMAHPQVKNLWKGIRREIGIVQKGKSAATIEVLPDAVAPFGARRIDGFCRIKGCPSESGVNSFTSGERSGRCHSASMKNC